MAIPAPMAVPASQASWASVAVRNWEPVSAAQLALLAADPVPATIQISMMALKMRIAQVSLRIFFFGLAAGGSGVTGARQSAWAGPGGGGGVSVSDIWWYFSFSGGFARARFSGPPADIL